MSVLRRSSRSQDARLRALQGNAPVPLHRLAENGGFQGMFPVMQGPAKRKQKRRRSRLYASSKISEYQFKKVLWHFACDDTASEAARHVRLSINSINAIYTKFRSFFIEARLFMSIYDILGDEQIEPEYEEALMGFHFLRIGEKQGLRKKSAHMQHFAESCYRFDRRMAVDRGESENLNRIIYQEMLSLIRTAGPVGKPVSDPLAALEMVLELQDAQLTRMERFTHAYSSEETRAFIKTMREL